jgi:thiamine-monophosphate kinase
MDSNEDRLIARYFKPIARHPGALRLNDDAAVMTPPPRHDLVVTVDAIVSGVHFFPDDPPASIARKALRVNLSDLAAKGAKPVGFLLTLSLPKGIGDRWLKAFAKGLGSDARAYGCSLLGGDTVHTPGPLSVSISAFGTVPTGKMVRRYRAAAGDSVVVTGTIGDAALGLQLRRRPALAARWRLNPAMRRHLTGRYLVPEPRNAMANAVRRYASAAMDVSDGLAGNLGKLCRASGVAAHVEVDRVPLSKAARVAISSRSQLLETALTGGDDYEIVATVPARKLRAFRAAAQAVGVPLMQIGTVVAGRGARFIDANGRELTFDRASFSHF